MKISLHPAQIVILYINILWVFSQILQILSRKFIQKITTRYSSFSKNFLSCLNPFKNRKKLLIYKFTKVFLVFVLKIYGSYRFLLYFDDLAFIQNYICDEFTPGYHTKMFFDLHFTKPKQQIIFY